MSPDMIDAMMDAGLTREQMAALIKHELEKQAAAKAEKRANDAARQRKSRASRNVTVTGCDTGEHTVTEPANAPACPRADLEPTTQEISYPKTPLKGVKKGEVLAPLAKPKSANAECIAELGKVLDPEHAQAVLDHRNRIRKPMTPYAAGRLAKSLSMAPDPNAAADEMIERGWQGWRPDWGRGSQGPPRQASNRRSLIDAIDRMIPDDPTPQPQYPRLAFGG